MDVVKVTAEVGSPSGPFKEVEFLADTGSLYTMVAPELAQELGVEFTTSTIAVTAGNVPSEVPLGFGRMRLMGRENTIIIGAMQVPMPLLGSTSMQALGLKVNPSDESMELTEPYPPPA